MKLIKRPVFVGLLLLLFCVTTAQGKATLWLRFIRFDNPGGKGDNGHCCDGRLIFCPSKCDHRFVVCLDRRYGRPYDTSYCPYGKRSTGEIADRDSIVFGGNVGGVVNPMLFNLQSWPGQVQLKIGVWDRDDNRDDFVDNLRLTLTSRPARSASSARRQRFTIKDRVSLVIETMLYCQPGSYGRACDVTCVPQNDVTAGYTCDRYTGQKLCTPGWTGENCDVSENDCVSNRCQHGATCQDGHQNYTCVCVPGFTGRHCEENVDECLSAPCQNNAVCADNHGSFRCTCNAGWTGLTCDADINECDSNPCVNASRCHNLQNDFSCVCDLGFTGKRCDTDINECLKHPCLNEGTCTNQEPGFQCACAQGFYGDTCEMDADECLTSPCSEGSTCVNIPGSFRCLCKPDFMGRTCDYQIDDCRGQECEHNGTCIDGINDFRCVCTEHFTGRKCGVYIDRCQATPCQYGATCRDPGFGHPLQCMCSSGWKGALCDQDIDECLQDPCTNGATCENTPGAFVCHCLQGWTGLLCQDDINECQLLVDRERGKTCESGSDENDECAQSPCPTVASCVNEDGGFHCVCPSGWQGDNCDEDINECQEGITINVCNGQNTTTTTTTNDCSPDSDPLCQQNASCTIVNDPACKNDASCINTPGNFSCECPPGWTGRYCEEDINECEREHLENLQNAISPENGLRNESDFLEEIKNSTTNPKFTDFDEEIAKSTSNPVFNTHLQPSSSQDVCANGGVCKNSLGSFTCLCLKGWSGSQCQEDVDECRSLPCKNHGHCSNFPGGFICSCTGPWEGELCDSEKDECRENPCAHNGTCVQRRAVEGGGVQCVCRRGWRGTECLEDRDECEMDPCFNGATCLNEPGTFTCACPDSLTGRTCSSDEHLDKDLSLPLYLRGRLGKDEEGNMTRGIQVFLEDHGDFRHDFKIRVYLATQYMLLGTDKISVTQVTITVVVENFTLPGDTVADILNRVPLKSLETYLPLPIFNQEVEEHIHAGQSHEQTPVTTIPWYAILLGSVIAAILALIVVLLIRRKVTVRWWPRKKSDTTVIYSQNGSLSSSLDTSIGSEYVNTQPDISTLPFTIEARSHSLNPSPNPSPNPSQSCAASNSSQPCGTRSSNGTLGLSQPNEVQPATQFNRISSPSEDSSLSPPNVAQTASPPGGVTLRRSSSGGSAIYDRPRSGSPLRVSAECDQNCVEYRDASSSPTRSEVVWTRSKEVQLRRCTDSNGTSALPAVHVGNGSDSSRVISMAKPATGDEDGHCFVNTVYMTIPDVLSSGAASPVTDGVVEVTHLPPDPNRGDLPPPPVSEAF